MNLVKQIGYIATAVKCYPKAWKFLGSNKLKHFFLYPVLVALGLFLVTSTLFTTASEELLNLGIDFFGLQEYKDSWLYTLAMWMMRLSFWMLFQSVNRYLVFIFMSPILAYISEKSNEILSNEKIPFNIHQLMSDILRGVVLALRNLSLELLITAVLWAISLIFPVVIPITVVLIFMFQCYFYGFGFIDYNLERKKFKRGASVRWMRQHFGLAFGIGAGFYLLFAIPYIGWILAPVLSCVAATLAFNKMFDVNDPKLPTSNPLLKV
jgi:CysZ protein